MPESFKIVKKVAELTKIAFKTPNLLLEFKKIN